MSREAAQVDAMAISSEADSSVLLSFLQEVINIVRNAARHRSWKAGLKYFIAVEFWVV